MNAPLRRVGVVVLVLFGSALRQPELGPGVQGRRRTAPASTTAASCMSEYERQRGDHRRRQRRGRWPRASRPRTAEVPAHLPGRRARTRRSSATGRSTWPRPASRRLENELPGRQLRLVQRSTGSGIVHRHQKPGGNVCSRSISRCSRRVRRACATTDRRSRTAPSVAIDPTTGEILAMARRRATTRTRWPATTPATRTAAYNKLNARTTSRWSTARISETYPPGSTFKVVVVGGGAVERPVHAGHRDPGGRSSTRRCPAAASTMNATPGRRSARTATVTLIDGADRSRATPASPSSA